MKAIKKLAILAAVALCAVSARPCSRVVFRGDSTDIVMVGRTLDWRTPIPTNIYVMPRGMQRQSMPDGPRYEWVSKYASVVAVGYDGGVTEGMNECGLVMNGLFCRGSEYKMAVEGSDTKVMSLAVIVSYFIENFATVDEVETWLRDNEFGINGKTFDGGTTSLLHWALTDRTGKTLIMEYQGGHLNLYASPDYQVLTNNPPFPDMLAISAYWNDEVGGMNMLPGTVRSSDRFARASYFIHHQPSVGVDSEQAYTQLASLMDNVSVPAGYEIPGQPNLSMTQWRSISDLGGLRYYFKFADALGTFYIDLNHLLLNQGAPVLKLDTADHAGFFGCVNDRLKRSEPFKPMW
ncbi:MAG: linear amide C-N hydrolase [Bacteroidales bacterium]|nr:linear amide C-N hydrolase [Bacteroidales bacterium]